MVMDIKEILFITLMKTSRMTLHILDDAIRDKILFIQNAKHYSPILNCTPNAEKTEQMSFITRFVSNSEQKVEIKENFFGFIKTFDSTGQSLGPLEGNIEGEKNGLQSMFLESKPSCLILFICSILLSVPLK